ncbi:sodium- and chloride-dependent glycine transporter 1-like isoform X1 [Diorhabda sublineata]|uniref:sodium- and chloride-dependent glycine transporter 1-like isoform X1 n=1 Tax=Diorhabda sublineata TaxID=1163346 RepID=UPI0024E185C2|nr:sodium- and chloride-dependent glycine transporter 1-like isoform X1 [Diorhabda sublineata]
MKNELIDETENSTETKFEERGQWRNKTEFILSLLGYAIGIGNIWRFPYLCYRNGGGAFLVPYLLMLFLCGIPLFFLEASLGQFGSVGCTKVFNICPLFKGAGYAMIVVNLIVCTYFNTICAYPLIFLVHCFNSKLPWLDCNNPWNTNNCSEVKHYNSNTSLLKSSIVKSGIKTPADEFFHHKILQISDEVDVVGGIVWPLFIANIISWVIMYICLIRGIKSVGKVVYFTATFPFIILSILFVRGITLPGAWDGIKYYIVPEWKELGNVKVWADAAIQIFFSLGPGWGGIVNIASYNNFKNNGRLDAIIVPLANSGTSIFAGFVVFSVLGFMSHETGEPLPSVATGGPGLAFITYPEAITLLPWPQLWAILFFFMLFLLGLDSLFVQLETVIAALMDEFPHLRKRQTLVTISILLLTMCLSTIYTTNGGMYWLQLFDWYAASISVVLICLVEVFMVGWIYGVGKFKRDIEFMIDEKLPNFWIISWKITTPLLLLFIFMMVIVFNTRIMYQKSAYPDWIVVVGWLSSVSSMICIPIYMIYKLTFLEKGTLSERIKSSLKDRNWGPAKTNDREKWENFIQNNMNLPKQNHQADSKDEHKRNIKEV